MDCAIADDAIRWAAQIELLFATGDMGHKPELILELEGSGAIVSLLLQGGRSSIPKHVGVSARNVPGAVDPQCNAHGRRFRNAQPEGRM